MDSRQFTMTQPNGLSSNQSSITSSAPSFSSVLQSSNRNNARNQNQQIVYEDESANTNPTSGAANHGGNNHDSTRPADTNTSTYKPSRKNAVIIENTQEISQDQCLRAVANIIGGRNIHYCTRLSGGRICLYLTNQEYVNQLVTEGGIVVNQVYLTIRKYITEATKFVISNCPPEMTDESLKKILEPYGRVVSSPTRLKVSTTHEDLKHIRTWRRIVYVMIPSEAPEAPKRLVVTSPEGVKTTLYIDKDEIMCDYCKVPGHLEEKCKKKASDQEDFPFFNAPPQHRIFNQRTQHGQRQNIANNQISLNAIVPQFMHGSKTPTPNTPQTSMSEERREETTNSLPSTNQQQMPSSSLDPMNLNTNDSLHSIWTQSLTEKSSSDHEKAHQSSSENSSGLNILCSAINSSLLTQDHHNQKPEETPLPSDTEVDKIIKTSQIENSNPHTKGKKRNLSKSPPIHNEQVEDNYESSSTSSVTSEKSQPPNKKKQKKKEKESKLIDSLLSQIKAKPSHLPDEVIKSFLADCRGQQNSRNVASRLGVTNFSALIVQINEILALCHDFNLQRRLKRAVDALITTNEV